MHLPYAPKRMIFTIDGGRRVMWITVVVVVGSEFVPFLLFCILFGA